MIKAEKVVNNLVTPCTKPPPSIWNCVLSELKYIYIYISLSPLFCIIIVLVPSSFYFFSRKFLREASGEFWDSVSGNFWFENYRNWNLPSLHLIILFKIAISFQKSPKLDNNFFILLLLKRVQFFADQLLISA